MTELFLVSAESIMAVKWPHQKANRLHLNSYVLGQKVPPDRFAMYTTCSSDVQQQRDHIGALGHRPWYLAGLVFVQGRCDGNVNTGITISASTLQEIVNIGFTGQNTHKLVTWFRYTCRISVPTAQGFLTPFRAQPCKA